jgi:ferredoxin
MSENAKVKKLVAKLAEICWDGGSLDGGELQEMLVEAGVLIGVVIKEPCAGKCRCSECDVEPPWVCYRLTEPFK